MFAYYSGREKHSNCCDRTKLIYMYVIRSITEGRIEMRLTDRKNVFIEHLGVLTHAREASNVVVGSQTSDQTAHLGTLRTYDGAIVGAP